MPKVEILKPFAWYKKGDVADVSDKLAKRYIESKRGKLHVEKPSTKGK